MSNLDGPIWTRCSIALTWPARSDFQRTRSRERWDQVWDKRYHSSREEVETIERIRKRKRAREEQKKRKRENRRPILRKLCAALLRSEITKNEERGRDNWDPRKVQQLFRPHPNGVGDCITTLRRLLI